MGKYLLLQEQKRIFILEKLMQNNFKKKNLNELFLVFEKIVKENKDKMLEDILLELADCLQRETEQIFNENITPGVQIGLKNKAFEIILYGGYLTSDLDKEITTETFFSLDSISKLMTSTIVASQIQKHEFNWNTPVNSINNDFSLEVSPEEILHFTASLHTSKRLENLSKEETIGILKDLKEDLTNKTANFYEYNDIGYMILRLALPNFLENLDMLLGQIDKTNNTYMSELCSLNTTGGKKNSEWITQDAKGRDIIFPGHTGLYSNVEGIMNLFYEILFTEKYLTLKTKQRLFASPYTKRMSLFSNKNKEQKILTKVAGVYMTPKHMTSDYDKLKYCDLSNLTTCKSFASAGTSGCWVMGDNLNTSNFFGTYTGGILSNPYSYIENKVYEQGFPIANCNLSVTKNGKIINYPRLLNPYKNIIAKYGIILELLTAYYKPNNNTYKKIKLKYN